MFFDTEFQNKKHFLEFNTSKTTYELKLMQNGIKCKKAIIIQLKLLL